MLYDFPIIVTDESVDARIIHSLVEKGYKTYSISKESPGISDNRVIEIAELKKWFIITEDKDFGDALVYHRINNSGSLLLRFSETQIEQSINLVLETLSLHHTSLIQSFSVLTSKKLRIRK